MACLGREAEEELDRERQLDYCEWCWFHDYGDCSKCAIKMEIVTTDQSGKIN